MNFRHWRLLFAVKLLFGFSLSMGLLMYSTEHQRDWQGVFAFVLGVIAIMGTNIYLIRFMLRNARRRQLVGPGQKEGGAKIISYEEFKAKRGVS